MANFKNKILEALKTDKNLENAFSILSKAQNNLIKNQTNPVFNTQDKNKILKAYSDLEFIGKLIYRYKILKENNLETGIKNLEDAVLKGGISNTRYIWHSENSENTCDACKALDGKVFEYYDEVPQRPHPNCKCYVEEIKEEACDCLQDIVQQFNKLIQEANNIQIDIKAMLSNLIEKLGTKAGKIYENVCQNIISVALTWDNAAGDFARNYNDMVEADTINGDKYFHSKANCQATQR